MTDTVLVTAAWPISNAEIHVGNLTGSYLPADIFARYNRLRGRKVLMVSGSDAHGTPITVRADAEGMTPIEVYKQFHNGFLDLFQQLGLTYDLFTSTHTANHFIFTKTFPGAQAKRVPVYRSPIPVVCPISKPVPPRPLCRRHLLYLRVYQRAQRPVR